MFVVEQLANRQISSKTPETIIRNFIALAGYRYPSLKRLMSASDIVIRVAELLPELRDLLYLYLIYNSNESMKTVYKVCPFGGLC